MANRLSILTLLITLPFFASAGSSLVSFSTEIVRHPKLSALSSESPAPIRSVVLPNSANHLIQLSIGTPPVKVLAIVDTGSDLIWSRCKPCVDCIGRSVPAFDPNLSSTYRDLPCDSTFCKSLDPSACSKGPTCTYTYGYGDGSTSTSGVLSTETLTFDSTTGGGSISIPSVAFGCSHNTSVSIDGHQVGLVGLGGQPISLVSQLGPSIDWKFSYCLVPFHENSSSSIMNFGEKAIVSGNNVVSTPLVPMEAKTFYYVTLESIRVGEIKIDAVSSTGAGNMFLDSGTTVTLLNTRVFNELADAITSIVKLPRTKSAGGSTFVCFETTSRDGFPPLTFSFAGGADLVLHPLNAFTVPSRDGLVCLAMQATEGTGVFGNLAQQNFHVGYDLKARSVSFAATECSKMLS